MTWQDFANGSFEMCGGFFLLKNVMRLYHDKLVRGVGSVEYLPLSAS